MTTLCDSMDLWPARLLCPGDSPGKNIGVGCHALLQGIFLTQGSNTGLPRCRRILYHLSHQGSVRQQVDSISFFQGIFPTQEVNQGLLHCRWILYHLSHQGSLNYTDLCQQMMSLLFNTLSRFIIAFLPRIKHLLISWLQSPSQ